MRLLCCCGAGGTGKTTTVSALKELMPEVIVLPSVSRSYFRIRGVENERTYLTDLSMAQRFDFQLGMLQFYMQSTMDAMEEAPINAKIVMDRSLFDHMAYALAADPDMTLSQYRMVMVVGWSFMKLEPRIAYFPHPTGWTGSAAVDDGFRTLKVGRDVILDALMVKMLRVYSPQQRTIAEAPARWRAERLEEMLA